MKKDDNFLNGLVTVITPTFNREKYLPEAIESVLNQTYQNLEFYIIDDGSTDNTKDIIKKYLTGNRVRYSYQDHRGTGPARNVGLKYSRGAFICFMDSDDIWVRDKIESQIELMTSYPGFDVVYGDIAFMDEYGNLLPTPATERYSGIITDKLLIDNFVTNVTAMFRRKCYEELGGLDDNLPRSDDYDLYLRYSMRYKFLYHKKVCAKVRVMPNQLSANKIVRMDVNKFIVKRFINSNKNKLSETSIREALHHLHVRSARIYAINGEYGKAIRDFVEAIRCRPSRVIALKGLMKAIILKR